MASAVALCLLPYVLPATFALGLALGGYWALLPLVYAFVVTPVLDAFFPPDITDHDPVGQVPTWLWDLPLLAWLPMQLGLMVWLTHEVAAHRAGLLAIIGLGIVAGGGGITVAHELMHRPQRLHRAFAELLMTLALYPHFCVEHVLGHHRKVATPDDPASARLGESVWRFLPRTLLGGLRSAWNLETERVESKGDRAWADRRIRHPVLAGSAVLVAGALGGWAGLLTLIGSAAVAVFLLEVINYVEHYGLTRRRREDGRYERVRPQHSWNSPHRVSGSYLFQLPRHSDHHFLASRPYHALRHHEEAPQLPASYPAMVILALAPPLWSRVMDPRVSALRFSDNSSDV